MCNAQVCQALSGLKVEPGAGAGGRRFKWRREHHMPGEGSMRHTQKTAKDGKQRTSWASKHTGGRQWAGVGAACRTVVHTAGQPAGAVTTCRSVLGRPLSGEHALGALWAGR